MLAQVPRSVRLDFDTAALAGSPVAEAGPRIVFRLLDQTACDRVAVDIAELLNELSLSENVEVIIAGLPEL